MCSVSDIARPLFLISVLRVGDGRNDGPPSETAAGPYRPTDRRRSAEMPRSASAANFRPAGSRIRFLALTVPRGKSRALHPALEERWQLGEVVDRRVGLDVDRLLRRSGERASPDRTQTQALCAPDVLDHSVANHDGTARRDPREAQRPPEDR